METWYLLALSKQLARRNELNSTALGLRLTTKQTCRDVLHVVVQCYCRGGFVVSTT